MTQHGGQHRPGPPQLPEYRFYTLSVGKPFQGGCKPVPSLRENGFAVNARPRVILLEEHLQKMGEWTQALPEYPIGLHGEGKVFREPGGQLRKEPGLPHPRFSVKDCYSGEAAGLQGSKALHKLLRFPPAAHEDSFELTTAPDIGHIDKVGHLDGAALALQRKSSWSACNHLPGEYPPQVPREKHLPPFGVLHQPCGCVHAVAQHRIGASPGAAHHPGEGGAVCDPRPDTVCERSLQIEGQAQRPSDVVLI